MGLVGESADNSVLLLGSTIYNRATNTHSNNTINVLYIHQFVFTLSISKTY